MHLVGAATEFRPAGRAPVKAIQMSILTLLASSRQSIVMAFLTINVDHQTPHLDMTRSQEQSKRGNNTAATYRNVSMPSLEPLYPDSEHSRKRKFPETSPHFAG